MFSFHVPGYFHSNIWSHCFGTDNSLIFRFILIFSCLKHVIPKCSCSQKKRGQNKTLNIPSSWLICTTVLSQSYFIVRCEANYSLTHSRHKYLEKSFSYSCRLFLLRVFEQQLFLSFHASETRLDSYLFDCCNKPSGLEIRCCSACVLSSY